MSRPPTARAEIDHVGVDVDGASAFAKRAELFLDNARLEALAPEARPILLHDAVLAGCDAVLAINGLRVVGSDGGHTLRRQKAEALLDVDRDDLYERLDDARDLQNAASYRAAPVPLPDADDGISAAAEFLHLVRDHVEPRLPERLR